ncbi:hypothetical protein [Planctomyces sp. SH-PL62]|uniref:hypothetical protein n=1 Tax=Planctomyces sp. SH-PL62 TaxID=1636152 RepID=UPI00078D7646|nr:hypothetical protein [Planctomyces sp. SH-PL62]AMV40322.1 hypothetical protein VT85_23020 [Planctomyces sp. SH-PL62]
MFGGIRYEQAVYGSFPFWSRGYAILAASGGCLPSWRDAMKRACGRFGEPPAGVDRFRSVFALPADRSTWMVVQVDSLGCDDQGRPGALAFHALFVSSWSYRLAGASPLAFRPAFRNDWTADDQDASLPKGRFRPKSGGREEAAIDPRVGPIVAALSRNRRVVVQTREPADELLGSIWRRLPGRTRRGASVASWAFGNANGFDFVALPRLGSLTLDGTELVLASEPSAGA